MMRCATPVSAAQREEPEDRPRRPTRSRPRGPRRRRGRTSAPASRPAAPTDAALDRHQDEGEDEPEEVAPQVAAPEAGEGMSGRGQGGTSRDAVVPGPTAGAAGRASRAGRALCGPPSPCRGPATGRAAPIPLAGCAGPCHAFGDESRHRHPHARLRAQSQFYRAFLAVLGPGADRGARAFQRRPRPRLRHLVPVVRGNADPGRLGARPDRAPAHGGGARWGSRAGAAPHSSPSRRTAGRWTSRWP